ncbi:MAG: hypothetical protein M3Z24_13425, partial [Chloroflexota bacterium]|nr:hypothetical protein [Chloroflexota bacterium]
PLRLFSLDYLRKVHHDALWPYEAMTTGRHDEDEEKKRVREFRSGGIHDAAEPSAAMAPPDPVKFELRSCGIHDASSAAGTRSHMGRSPRRFAAWGVMTPRSRAQPWLRRTH